MKMSSSQVEDNLEEKEQNETNFLPTAHYISDQKSLDLAVEVVQQNKNRTKIISFGVGLIIFVVGVVAFILATSNNEDPQFACGTKELDDFIRFRIKRFIDRLDLEEFEVTKQIDFSESDLNCLPSKSFSDLDPSQKDLLNEVEILNFNDANISAISSSAFSVSGVRFENLSDLLLNDNNLKHMPDKLFSKLPNLEFIQLRNNLFVTLRSKVFSNVKRLFFVDLSENKFLNEIPPAIQNSLSLGVRIDNCEKLQEVKKNIFAKSEFLLRLSLTNTPIVELFTEQEFRDFTAAPENLAITGF